MLSVEENQVVIEKYKELIQVSENKVELQMKSYGIIIEGDSLHILALEKQEILLQGCVRKISFAYEK